MTKEKKDKGSVVRYIRSLFLPKCCKCKKGRIDYERSITVDDVWVDVYKCSFCKEELKENEF